MTFQTKLAQAFNLFEDGKWNKSIEIYKRLLTRPLSTDDKIKLRFGYGYPLSAAGLVEEALTNYYDLKELGERTNRNDIVSQAIHQLGMVHRQAKQYEEALEKFHKEQNFIKKQFPNNSLFIAANTYELGYTNLLLNNDEEAYRYLKESLVLSEKTKDAIMIASAHRGLGEYYLSQTNHVLAKKHFNESIRYFNKDSDHKGKQEVEELLKLT
jgi:tetratricopeptide (TPR) repeat protein